MRPWLFLGGAPWKIAICVHSSSFPFSVAFDKIRRAIVFSCIFFHYIWYFLLMFIFLIKRVALFIFLYATIILRAWGWTASIYCISWGCVLRYIFGGALSWCVSLGIIAGSLTISRWLESTLGLNILGWFHNLAQSLTLSSRLISLIGWAVSAFILIVYYMHLVNYVYVRITILIRIWCCVSRFFNFTRRQLF